MTRFNRFPALALLALVCLSGGPSLQAQPLPPVEQVLKRLTDRSAALAASTNSPAWTYDKLTVMEQLDDDDKVQRSEEKLFQVRMIQGVPFSRLVSIKGRELTESEVARENQREATFQKRVSGRDPHAAVTNREALITGDLLDRFQFKVLRREPIHDRTALAVGFTAKPGHTDDKLHDRLLNRLAGTFWMDETTGDVARLQVRLTKGFSMGMLGVLGSLKTCTMDMTSRPMPDGTWLPEVTHLYLSARVLLSSVHFRTEERSSNYRQEPPQN